MSLRVSSLTSASVSNILGQYLIDGSVLPEQMNAVIKHFPVGGIFRHERGPVLSHPFPERDDIIRSGDVLRAYYILDSQNVVEKVGSRISDQLLDASP